MEQNEEMVIMKSDIAIAVKKDGTFIINNPKLETYVKLYEGIAAYLKTAGEVCVAEFCVGEMVGRAVIKEVMGDKMKELEEKKKRN